MHTLSKAVKAAACLTTEASCIVEIKLEGGCMLYVPTVLADADSKKLKETLQEIANNQGKNA